MLNSKKARIIDILLTPAFVTVIVLGLVLLTILNKIYVLGSTTAFEKKFFATDLALTMDILPIFKENLLFAFSNGYNFSISVDKNKILVYAKNKTDKELAQIPFIEDKKFNYKYLDLLAIDKPISPLYFIKYDRYILLTQTIPLDFNFNFLECDKDKLDLPEKIYIDPGHGFNEIEAKEEFNRLKALNQEKEFDYKVFGDPGKFIEPFSLEKLRESQIVRKISCALFGYFRGRIITDKSYVCDDKEIKERIENAKNSNITISIHIGDLENTIKIYFNGNSKKSFESMNLGCLIANEIIKIEEFKNFNTVLIPINLNYLKEDDKKVLLEEKIGILIEIGNITQAEKIKNNANDIAKAIHNIFET